MVVSYPPETRSAAVLYRELAESLTERGHQVTVVTGVPRYSLPEGVAVRGRERFFSRKTRNGVRVVRLPMLPVPRRMPLARGLEQMALAWEYLLGALLTSRPDVTLVYSPPLPLGLAARGLRILKRVPFVFNVQDVYPQAAIDLGLLTNRRIIAFAERMERYIYKHAVWITVHSEGNRTILAQRGASAEKVVTIPNWVDVDMVRPGERMNAFRQRHGLGEKFVVSFAGNMGYAQGLEPVLEAARLLRDRNDILFLLVGDGALKSQLMQRAEALDLRNTRFLPLQPVEEYPNVLAASDACLVTLQGSVNTPVVPAKLLSIMASGRPVLASIPAQGDAAQIVTESRCGVVVSPEAPDALAEAIRQLRANAQGAAEMGGNGRAYAEAHLSRRSCVAMYEDLLLRAAGIPKAARTA